jgi:hypothetical protein
MTAPDPQPPAAPETDVSARLTEGERETLESYLVALWQCETERGYLEFVGRVLSHVEQVKEAGALIAADDASDPWRRSLVKTLGRAISAEADLSAARERVRVVESERDAARATHRDLVSRLGFGDNITEPMADNETIVAWFEQQGRDANEWVESQLWRNDCYAAGHPQDDDCHACDPRLALLARAESAEAAHEALRADLEALADAAEYHVEHSLGRTFTGETFPAVVQASALRALLAGDAR